MDIQQEQARRLFDEGAILLLTDLPDGSEVGIDGDSHAIRRFSGFKMIPPGIHLITWSTSNSSTAIRHGLLYDFQPRRTLVLKYNSVDDQVHPSLAEESGLPLPSDISREQLRSLDAELAPYPFPRMADWRELVGSLSAEDVRRVTHTGLVDSLMESPADQEVAQMGTVTNNAEPTLSFPPFDVKRSWRVGAVGEEVTRFAKDKSWLWCDVVSRQYGGDPTRLLSDLTLAFIIFVHLHNFSSLLAYKRFLILCCRSAGLTSQSTDVLADQFPSLSVSSVNTFFTSFIAALRHHLTFLPDDFFSADLEGTGIEQFLIGEITELAAGISGITTTTSGRKQSEYESLRALTMQRFGWDLPSLNAAAEANARAEADDEDEEGEYAPAVVDM